jgi:predicted small integral membrane protein
MVTHIAWDSFTHSDAIIVKAIPALSQNLLVFGYSIPVFKILQHGSTIAGILFILIYLYGKRRTVINLQRIPWSKKVFFFLLALSFSALLMFAILNVKPWLKVTNNICAFVITGLDCVFAGLLFSSLVSRLWIHKQPTMNEQALLNSVPNRHTI